MDFTNKDQKRAQYLATSEALERVRARELFEMTDEEAIQRMMTLTACETPWRERPNWSGLVEQQAIFMRARIK